MRRWAVARFIEALNADDWSEREKRRMQWQSVTVAVESLDDGPYQYQEGCGLSYFQSSANGLHAGGTENSNAGNKKMVEETFYLPFQPSPYVLSFLFSACREIHRVFAHAPDPTVLHHLVAQLLLG